jgi:hypothetical protein
VERALAALRMLRYVASSFDARGSKCSRGEIDVGCWYSPFELGGRTG